MSSRSGISSKKNVNAYDFLMHPLKETDEKKKKKKKKKKNKNRQGN